MQMPDPQGVGVQKKVECRERVAQPTNSLALLFPSRTQHTLAAMSRFIVAALATLLAGANGECARSGVGR